MKYYSTRNRNHLATLEEAVLRGIAPDGGLYMPEHIPKLSNDFLRTIPGRKFPDICLEIASQFMRSELGMTAIESIIQQSIAFDAPLRRLSDNLYVLELFHGPTMAFKDFAARFMASLLSHFVIARQRNLTVLVATSGDTGGAVAQSFAGIEGIDVVVLYPSGKVTPLQEKQITTVCANVRALEISGTFDDCQALVKQAFLDHELQAKRPLTSANSINIARLIPQTFYYFRAFSQLETPAPCAVSVPCGNFGNITAGLITKHMGLPIDKFMAATNINKVVPEYLKSGIFSAKASIATISNAMDVGSPSNFARISALYNESHSELCADLVGASFSDTETRSAITELFNSFDYIADPHTAVGYLGVRDLQRRLPAGIPLIFLSTAHPAKFLETVQPLVNTPIELPPRLKEVLTKTKHSTLLPPKYSALKAWLI